MASNSSSHHQQERMGCGMFSTFDACAIELTLGYDLDVYIRTHVQFHSTYPVHLRGRTWRIQLYCRRIPESIWRGNTDHGLHLYLHSPGLLMIDGLLAFTTIALIQKAPTIREPSTQLIVIFIWAAGILFIYSFLIYVFRIKNGGYPFRLFL